MSGSAAEPRSGREGVGGGARGEASGDPASGAAASGGPAGGGPLYADYEGPGAWGAAALWLLGILFVLSALATFHSILVTFGG